MGATGERLPPLVPMDRYRYQVGNNLLQENGWFVCLCHCNVWVKVWIHTLVNNLTWSVLNPSIGLSWIQRHWEPNYVARAVVITKSTVSRSVCYGDSTLIYLLQMWKYHDCLHGQAQQPTPSTAASQQQRQSWHGLAGQYGLEDMLDVSGTSLQLSQGVEEQFELYQNGLISPRGTDIVGFWAVSTMSHYFPICITDLFSDKRRNPSNIICNGIRLFAHSSVLGSFQACFFI